VLSVGTLLLLMMMMMMMVMLLHLLQVCHDVLSLLLPAAVTLAGGPGSTQVGSTQAPALRNNPLFVPTKCMADALHQLQQQQRISRVKQSSCCVEQTM
jgi:hypothetical protein